MDRRDFFKYSAGAALSMSMLSRAADVFAKNGPDENYSVVILGDTHYDVKDPEVYHAGYTDPNPEREANHRKEFVRNGEMWAERCPALVKRAAGLVDKDTRFVLQMGDLVQGDTGEVDLGDLIDGLSRLSPSPATMTFAATTTPSSRRPTTTTCLPA